MQNVCILKASETNHWQVKRTMGQHCVQLYAVYNRLICTIFCIYWIYTFVKSIFETHEKIERKRFLRKCRVGIYCPIKCFFVFFPKLTLSVMNVCEGHYRFNNSIRKGNNCNFKCYSTEMVSSKETLSLNDQTITAKNYRITENKLGQHCELS